MTKMEQILTKGYIYTSLSRKKRKEKSIYPDTRSRLAKSLNFNQSLAFWIYTPELQYSLSALFCWASGKDFICILPKKESIIQRRSAWQTVVCSSKTCKNLNLADKERERDVGVRECATCVGVLQTLNHRYLL